MGAIEVPCQTIWQTPTDSDYHFGFNDITPWNLRGDQLTLLRIPGEVDHLPNGSEAADVCIWHPESGEIEKLAETMAWNFQQGARQRWLSDNEIMFNYLEGDVDRSTIVSISGEVLHRLPKAVYALSPDGRTGISPSLGRVHTYCPGYGYVAKAPAIEGHAPAADGLWEIDIVSGDVRLLLSLADIAAFAPMPTGHPQFVSHIWYSPSGNDVLFVHGILGPDGGAFANLMVMANDGSNLRRVASERISHPCWLDDRTIAVWSRNSRALKALRQSSLLSSPLLQRFVQLGRSWQGRSRNALLGEGLLSYSVVTSSPAKVLAAGLINENGHFSMHPTRRLLVGDTYPDRNETLHLYLYDLDRQVKVSIGQFQHEVRWPSGYLRSDLHPRWNRRGDQIAVDTSNNGVRRMVIVDAAPALASLDALDHTKQDGQDLE